MTLTCELYTRYKKKSFRITVTVHYPDYAYFIYFYILHTLAAIMSPSAYCWYSTPQRDQY